MKTVFLVVCLVAVAFAAPAARDKRGLAVAAPALYSAPAYAPAVYHAPAPAYAPAVYHAPAPAVYHAPAPLAPAVYHAPAPAVYHAPVAYHEPVMTYPYGYALHH